MDTLPLLSHSLGSEEVELALSLDDKTLHESIVIKEAAVEQVAQFGFNRCDSLPVPEASPEFFQGCFEQVADTVLTSPVQVVTAKVEVPKSINSNLERSQSAAEQNGIRGHTTQYRWSFGLFGNLANFTIDPKCLGFTKGKTGVAESLELNGINAQLGRKMNRLFYLF